MDEIIERCYKEFCESENSPFEDLNEEYTKQEILLFIRVCMELPKKQKARLFQCKKMHKERMLRRMWLCYKQGFLKGLEMREEELKK